MREAHDSPLHERHSPLSILKSKMTRNQIPSDILAVCKLPDINAGHRIVGPITALCMHPNERWVLASGCNQQAFIFSSDQIRRQVLFSIKIPDFKIVDACFVDSGRKVLLLGNHENLMIWSLLDQKIETFIFPGHRDQKWTSLKASPCHRFLALSGDGCRIAIFDTSSLLLRKVLKTNSRNIVTTFSGDGSFLFSAGTESRVYIWETRCFDCLRIFTDDAGTQITCLSSSLNCQFLAVGANTGILNLYEISSVMEAHESKVKPFKCFENLITKITSIEFHPSSELLAYSSPDKYGALRIIHIPSRRVYSNWPKEKTPIFHSHRIQFDHDGALFYVGNEKGIVTSYGLIHYMSLTSTA